LKALFIALQSFRLVYVIDGPEGIAEVFSKVGRTVDGAEGGL